MPRRDGGVPQRRLPISSIWRSSTQRETENPASWGAGTALRMPLHADERRWRRLPAFAGVLSGGVRVRKLVVYELISLDGVAENPEEFLTDWTTSRTATSPT